MNSKFNFNCLISSSLLIKYCLIFVFTLSGFTLDNKSEFVLPIRARSIFTSDIDLDNDLDLLIGHAASSIDSNVVITILSNNGDGIFQIKDTIKSFFGSQYDIFTLKVNNDDLPDIIAFNTVPAKSYNLRIIYNNNGYFNQYTDYVLTNNYNNKSYGDIDDDNDMDIIIASNSGQIWGILYNNGTGQFTSQEYYNILDSYPSDIECGKINNDNRDDVVISGQKTNLYFSNLSGFTTLQLDDNYIYEIEIADMDDDGDNDIVALYYLTGTYLYVYENLENGNFIKHDAAIFDENTFNLDIDDFNNDTLPDAVCTGDNGIYVLFNKGNFILDQPVFYPVNYTDNAGGFSHCADLNNDGFVDIATIVHQEIIFGSVLTLFFNDGSGNFIPNPPTHITQRMDDGEHNTFNAFPNPIKSYTTLCFKLENKVFVELIIKDLNGKTIRTLINNELAQGEHEYVWDKHNDNDFVCKPGIYLAIIKTNHKTESLKLLLHN